MISLETALAKAQEFGLDRVEVSPMAKPPVCKDHGLRQVQVRDQEEGERGQEKQTVVKLKEVSSAQDRGARLRLQDKAIREFLAEGNKARVTVMFRGREITHREIGQAILRRIEAELKDIRGGRADGSPGRAGCCS